MKTGQIERIGRLFFRGQGGFQQGLSRQDGIPEREKTQET
jgi:hypothetical protein